MTSSKAFGGTGGLKNRVGSTGHSSGAGNLVPFGIAPLPETVAGEYEPAFKLESFEDGENLLWARRYPGPPRLGLVRGSTGIPCTHEKFLRHAGGDNRFSSQAFAQARFLSTAELLTAY